MANETILISEVIPTTPQRIFSAWLDSGEHSSFTGSQAAVLPFVGGAYSAWDGYVQGKTLELNDGTRIVQSWRTTEFPGDSPDSRLEITLEPTLGGTLLTLLHTDIPSGQSDRYREGWNEYYLSRMKSYFAAAVDTFDKDDFSAALDGFDLAAEIDAVDFPMMGSVTPAVSPSVPPQTKQASAERPAKAALKSTAKKPAKAVLKAAAKKPAKAVLKAAAKKPAKAVLKAAAKKPAKAVLKAAAKKPAKAVLKAAAKKPAKAVSKAVSKRASARAKITKPKRKAASPKRR